MTLVCKKILGKKPVKPNRSQGVQGKVLRELMQSTSHCCLVNLILRKKPEAYCYSTHNCIILNKTEHVLGIIALPGC